MPQSLALVLVHIIFSTKNRIAFLQSHFGWQSGYGAFFVSQSAKESVISYIANQEIHHRKMTFQEEFRSLLKKHSIAFDERYVWD